MPKKIERPIKRPYATHYYTDANSPIASFSSQGAAASDRGAIRASVVRIFMGEYAKAVIEDRRTGIAVYTVRLGARGLQVSYGSAGEASVMKRRGWRG